uniref:NUDIX hydrolase n=1 Tax=uncultured Thiotrichaceae bacterium TaxID=298394 RepID=A0A6S6UJ42_9GAMM|nr:MAG: NUDIX hydrolase [uncultured Thiotrichaceae bacterium]
MSYPDRILACNNVCFDRLLPWYIDGVRYGWIDPKFAAYLRDFPEVFDVGDNSVTLHSYLSQYQQRTTAVNQVVHELHRSGVIDTRVGEAYPVVLHYDGDASMEIERAAASFFGIRSFGVHVNGLVRKQGEIRVWVGTRSRSKPFWPGKLDQIVAGGQPVGISLLDNVIKEAEEEAAIPAELAQQAERAAEIHYEHQTYRGLENSTLFAYDLWLPEDFVPVNNDGEVEGFQLISLSELAELTEHTDKFKDNCNLVNIDLLLRYGVITETHKDYAALTEALYKTKEG